MEIEKKGNFINKTAEIAKKHGYDIRYDEDNQTLALVIDVDHTVDTSDVTETIVEILNAVPTLPEIDYPDTTFQQELKITSLNQKCTNFYTIL